MLSIEEVAIAGRIVGPSAPCFVIAEAGVNHNGDVELASRLVDAAADSGADAVKFQTWTTEKLVAPSAPYATYQRDNVGSDERDLPSLLRSLELERADFRRLQARAHERGIIFLSTPDEEESADFLAELRVPALKIASAEVSNLPFLRHVAAKGVPIILSTGMADLGEVDRAVRELESAGTEELVLLQCTSAYPVAPEDVNLRAMDTLRTAFRVPVGFSDHTLGTDVAVASVARGACVLEKHLTLDRSLPGPDHAASLEPAEFATLVASIRRVEAALGDGVKRLRAVESDARRAMHKVLVAARSLEAGEAIGSDDVTFLRSSAGLPLAALQSTIGRVLSRPLAAGDPITRDALL